MSRLTAEELQREAAFRCLDEHIRGASTGGSSSTLSEASSGFHRMGRGSRWRAAEASRTAATTSASGAVGPFPFQHVTRETYDRFERGRALAQRLAVCDAEEANSGRRSTRLSSSSCGTEPSGFSKQNSVEHEFTEDGFHSTNDRAAFYGKCSFIYGNDCVASGDGAHIYGLRCSIIGNNCHVYTPRSQHPQPTGRGTLWLADGPPALREAYALEANPTPVAVSSSAAAPSASSVTSIALPTRDRERQRAVENRNKM
jgi:hypothetical protein